MEFEMLKKVPDRSGDEPIKDLFNLGELDMTLTILPEQIYNICDTNRGTLSITKLEMLGIISNYLFINMGGSKDTAPETVMAFMYLLVGTNKFNYNQITSDLLTAVSADNAFKYLYDNDIKPPAEFLEKIFNTAGEWLYRVLMDRYQLEEEKGWPEDKVQEFLNTITSKTTAYVRGEGGLNNLLNDLGI